MGFLGAFLQRLDEVYNPLVLSFLWQTASIALWGLLINLLVMLALWGISIRKNDVSIVDIYWGSSFVVMILTYFVVSGLKMGRSLEGALWIPVVLAFIWGVRLTAHLWKRNSKLPEDRRYTQMRKGRETYFVLWSLVFVFLFQGALAWWISLPFAFSQSLHPADVEFGLRWNPVTFLGLIIWVVGFTFEVVGDAQLAEFKRNPNNKGRVMDQGLWRYTRHPNYFGDSCLWWGFWLIAVGCSGDLWFLTLLTVLSPMTMTFFLLNVSGVSLLEKDIAERRPQYADYIRRTPAFFPWFPKK